MAMLRPLGSREQGMDLHLEEVERELLLSLTAQLIDFVGSDATEAEDPLVAMVGIDPKATPSEDPALHRLLPDAFRDDEEASLEFRRFTERDLRDAKVRNAQSVRASLEADGLVVHLSEENIPAWLGFLNDTRLVLGARLDITEENQDELAELDDDDPRAALYGLYGWLTYLQETLVQALLA
jgi:hypothetical protein